MEKLFDLNELQQTISRRFCDDDVFEARFLRAAFKGEMSPRNCSGYFTPLEFDRMQKELLRVEYYDQFWLSLNPVHKKIKDRSDCKFTTRPHSLASCNEDIDRYKYLYIDFDVLKPIEHKDNCTTSKEKEAAYRTVIECRDFLKQYGFPDPFEISDSGNGFHMLYACDLPTTYSAAVRAFLKSLKYRFANNEVKIDDQVFNAGRMIRPPGSKNQKGKNLPNRPHRNARLIEENIPIRVDAATLEDFIDKSRWIEKIESARVTNKCDSTIEDIIKKSGLEIVNLSNPAKSGSALVYKAKCLMCNSSDASAYICKFKEGFSYSCYHESCDATTPKFANKFKIKIDQIRADDSSPTSLSEAFSSYKYDGQSALKLPRNYKFEDGCLKIMDGKTPREVVSQPIYLGAILEDVNNQSEQVQICFHRHGSWRHHIVPKEKILNRQMLIQLAGQGLSVGSDNATMLTNYFRCFDVENEKSMKHARSSAKMGWQEIDKKVGFLWGQKYINKSGVATTVDLLSTQARHWPDDCIAFQAASDGEQQLVECLKSSGTVDGWDGAMNWACEHPNLLTMILGSFAAPLLKILNQDNMILDFCNRTSSGKTTGMVFAASVWGDPDKSEGGALIKSWDATKTSAERMAYARNHMPIFLDDTKAAIDIDTVTAILYMLSNGQGRPRGNIVGIDRDRNFKTVTISTGEDSVTDFSSKGGSMARVLQVSGPMFTKSGKAFAVEISQQMETVIENYGFGGPAFVSYLIENQSKWPEWRDLHREKSLKIATRDENILNRLAKSMAVLSVCADLLRDAGILDVSEDRVSSALKLIWDKCRDNADGSDREVSALKAVEQHLSINQDRVLLVEGNEKINFSKTLAGDEGSVFATKINRGHIGKCQAEDGMLVRLSVNNGVVEKVLKENGYSPKAIKSQWLELGWIEKRNDGSPTKPVRLGGKASINCVVFNAQGCEKVDLYGSGDATPGPMSIAIENAQQGLSLGQAEDWEAEGASLYE